MVRLKPVFQAEVLAASVASHGNKLEGKTTELIITIASTMTGFHTGFLRGGVGIHMHLKSALTIISVHPLGFWKFYKKSG